jgi:hypothetical protein
MYSELLEHRSIDGGGSLGLDPIHGFALTNKRLQAYGSQLMMARGEHGNRALDAEQLGNEVFEMRSERDQQFGFRFAQKSAGIGARFSQAFSD